MSVALNYVMPPLNMQAILEALRGFPIEQAIRMINKYKLPYHVVAKTFEPDAIMLNAKDGVVLSAVYLLDPSITRIRAGGGMYRMMRVRSNRDYSSNIIMWPQANLTTMELRFYNIPVIVDNDLQEYQIEADRMRI